MPAIRKDRAALDLRNNPQLATEPGDWNYLYTLEYIRMWKAEPRYATFHAISRTIERPESDLGVLELTRSLRPTVKETDLYTARREAVAEFRRKVVGPYEDRKYQNPENVHPYEFLEEEVKA